MGFLFAASTLALFRFAILPGAVQWILLWLGLQHMRACHPCFDKARPWLLGAIAADCLTLALESAGAPQASMSLLGAAQAMLWLYTWYRIYCAIAALEPVYGDLHGRALLRLWRGTACVWLYGCCVSALGPADLLHGGRRLYWAGMAVLCAIRAAWLYRAWSDYAARARQLASNAPASPEEEKDR